MGNVATGKLVDEGKSDIAPGLNRDAMFADGWWCEYCICDGTVIGSLGNPYCGAEKKELCEHETCQLVDIPNPFCSDHEVFFCITSQCEFPKMEGSPTCVCCNKMLAGDESKLSGWKPELFEWKNEFKNQFWIYYFLCYGYGFNGIKANERPMIAKMEKTLCIKEGCRCVPITENGIFCAALSTDLCFWEQCQCPPADNNPKCAICGWKANKEAGKTGNLAGGGKPAPMKYGVPGQREMS